MLSNTCKYAIRAAIYLAVNSEKDKKIGIKKISKDLDLPTPFLGKILQTLAKHKLLSSTKGPNGGFGLGKDAKDILIIDIVSLIDGIDIFNKCGIGVKNCSEENKLCTIHSRYSKLREEMKDLFKSTNLSNLVDELDSNENSVFI